MANTKQEPFLLQWTRRFRLTETDLALAPRVFPLFHDPLANLTLAELAAEVAEGPAIALDGANALQQYVTQGEFRAAQTLLAFMPDAATPAVVREIERAEEALLSQAEAELRAVWAKVQELSKLAIDDGEIEVLIPLVEQRCRVWLRSGRLGPARQLLDQVQQQINQHIRTTTQRLRDRAEALRKDAARLSYEQRHQVESLLDTCLHRLEQNELRLADTACRHAAIVLEGGQLPTTTKESRPVPRLEPMPLRATALLRILSDDSLRDYPDVGDWSSFLRRWQIERIRKSETASPVIDAVAELASTAADSRVQTGPEHPWPRFLRRFFSVLNGGPALQGFNPLKYGMGAFAHLVRPLRAPGSFLDANPDLWRHDPLVAVCALPKQGGDFARELVKHNVAGRLTLVFAKEPVAKQFGDQIRAELSTHGAYPVIFDEPTILSILCAEDMKERTDRFVAAMARQLPARLVNPFRAENAVSDAMFFGRTDEINRLLNSGASWAVFGGRKLGKTSLLRKVERVSEEQNSKSVAVWVDIRNCATDRDVQMKILAELAHPSDHRKSWKDKFTQHIDLSNPSTLVEQLNGLASEFPDHQFLFLLDEADGYLHRTATTPQGMENLGWDLRSLAAAQPRIRFIFAGFQDIYRACREALEGPWYNFIQLLELKVLKPEDAEDLVVQSLALLGCYFDTPELVQRILDYTSCHASLVQLFCHQLFERVADTTEPGYAVSITSNDVEAIFTSRDFRQYLDGIIQVNVTGEGRIKRALKLILHAWVYRLYHPRQAVEPQETVTAGALYAFLEEEFGMDEVHAALTFHQVDSFLNDLLVLGVLDRTGHKYFLRNRYFAGMLAHQWGGRLRNEVARLLSDVAAATVSDHQRRLWLSEEEHIREFSPFTRADEQRWRSTSSGTILVLGGPASGKSWALKWVEKKVAEYNQAGALPLTQRIDLAYQPSRRAAVDHIFRSVGVTGGWPGLVEWAKEWSAKAAPQHVCYLLLDNADCLADPEFLCLADDEEGFLERCDNLSQACGGRVKVMLSAGLTMARVWAAWGETFSSIATAIPIRRLTTAEVRDWAEGHRLDLGEQLAEPLRTITGGHPYVLRRFYDFLDPKGAEKLVMPDHLEEFKKALTTPGELRTSISNRLLQPDHPKFTTVLPSLREIAAQLGDPRLVITRDVCDLAAQDHRELHNVNEWVEEATALALIDELDPVQGEIGRLRPLDLWEREVPTP